MDAAWNALAGWKGRHLGPIEPTAEVDSTNAELLRRVDAGRATDGSILVALRQTAGHGSRGRAWREVEGRSLALSAAIAWPRTAPLALATWLGVVAVTDLLLELDLPAAIKWPNDALVDGRKIAGVLAEARARGDATWIALGIGVNVGQRAGDFAGEFATPPTSLALEGRALELPDAAIRLVEHLDRRALSLRDGGDPIRAAFVERLGLLAAPVRAVLPDRIVEGPLRDLALDGTLTIGGERLPGGHVAALRRL